MPRRIVIVGGPHTGKTTLSNRLKDELRIANVMHSTDDLMDLGWSQSSEAASKWFSDQGDWIVEGVSTARALRKWLNANPGVPLDADVLVVRDAFTPLKPGQRSMTAGVYTVFNEIEPELKRRGARVQKLNNANHAIELFQNEQTRDRAEKKSMSTDTLVYFGDAADRLACYGGAVKALGGGKVNGYLVIFSGQNDPDLQGEYFTKDTDFFIENGDKRAIIYRHGLHPTLKGQKIGKAELSIDDVGVFLEGELDLSNRYVRALYEKAQETQSKNLPFLGFSSGATSHLVVKRISPNGKAKEITAWPIGEASITPAPVEPRTMNAIALKELAADPDIDLDAMVKSEEPEEEPVSLEGLPALKALCEALSPAVTISKLEHSKIADAAVKELLTHNRIFVDAFRHYRVRLDQHVEFRKERNRKPLSDSQAESLKSWKAGLTDVRQGIESVESDLDGTLKRTTQALAEADAAERHAQFLMQQLQNLNSIIAKE